MPAFRLSHLTAFVFTNLSLFCFWEYRTAKVMASWLKEFRGLYGFGCGDFFIACLPP
jgi:hypothetical protein